MGEQKQLTGWEVAQNLGFKALSTGYPIVFIPPLTLIAIFYFVPNDEKRPFLEGMINNSAVFWSGWVASAVLICVWFVHVKWLKSRSEAEICRVSEERNKLQSQLAPISSSRRQA